VPEKRVLEIAVIGAAHIAQQHLSVLVILPEAVVTTLVDTDPQALEETAQRFGIPQRLESHRTILEQAQPDAVFVLYLGWITSCYFYPLVAPIYCPRTKSLPLSYPSRLVSAFSPRISHPV